MEAMKKLQLFLKFFFGLVLALSKSKILCFFFSYSLIFGWILMKEYLNNRANRENLDLLHFFSKSWLIRLKKNVLKIIPYFASVPCNCVQIIHIRNSYYNCLVRIIIISYLKPYYLQFIGIKQKCMKPCNCMQTNDYQIEIVTR